jgi:hypothetical protein
MHTSSPVAVGARSKPAVHHWREVTEPGRWRVQPSARGGVEEGRGAPVAVNHSAPPSLTDANCTVP